MLLSLLGGRAKNLENLDVFYWVLDGDGVEEDLGLAIYPCLWHLLAGMCQWLLLFQFFGI